MKCMTTDNAYVRVTLITHTPNLSSHQVLNMTYVESTVDE